jgi:phenylacetate-CoA ligase
MECPLWFDAATDVLILLPWQRPGSVGDLLIKALGQMGIRVTPYGPIDDFHNVARDNCQRKYYFFSWHSYPSSRISQIYGKHWKGYSSPIRTMLLTTDYVSPSTVKYVEKALDCQVFNHYGMTEMGLGGAVDCEAHQGYHLRQRGFVF